MENQIAVQERKAQLAKNTWTKLLGCYSPKNSVREFRKVNTIQKSIETGLPSLVRYKLIIGEEKVEALIKMWLIDLNNCLNLRRPMSEENISLIAIYILDDFGNLTIPDINLVFSRAKKGHYGELYESINTAKVLGWFSEYFEERMVVCAEMNILKHDQLKSKVRQDRKEGVRNPLKLSVKDLNQFIKGSNIKK